MTEDSPARRIRNKQREEKEKRRELGQHDEDIRALKRLLKYYTAKRDWFMVRRLSADLVYLFHWREQKEIELSGLREVRMTEAVCKDCGETFIPASEEPEDLIHGVRDDGEDCGGQGTVTGDWVTTIRA